MPPKCIVSALCPSCHGPTISLRRKAFGRYIVDRDKRRCIDKACWKAQRTRELLTCECGKPKTHIREFGCPDCQRMESERNSRPVGPRAEILAVLAHNDWMPTGEIADAYGYLGEARFKLFTAMAGLVRDGVVEVRGEHMKMEYRLVKRGRRAA